MSAPRLTRRLALEEPQTVSDGAGGFTESWVSLGTLWAEMRAGSGREGTRSAVPLGRVAWRITVPMAPPDAPSRPRAGQRFREGTRLFRIHAVAESDTRGAWLTCFAEEEEPA